MIILIILSILVVIIFFTVGSILIQWSVHKEMSKDYSLKYGLICKKINFKYFLKEFILVKWGDYDSGMYPKSYFLDYDENITINLIPYNMNKIHCGIIVINGIGYYFGFFTYIKFMIWNLKKHEPHIGIQLMEL